MVIHPYIQYSRPIDAHFPSIHQLIQNKVIFSLHKHRYPILYFYNYEINRLNKSDTQ